MDSNVSLFKLEITRLFKVNGSETVNVQFEATYLHRVRIITSELETLDASLLSLSNLNELGKSLELSLEEQLGRMIGKSRNRRRISEETFVPEIIDLTFSVFSWTDYLTYKESQLAQLQNGNSGITVPEIFAYLQSCTTCSILPMIDYTPSSGSPLPSVGDPMCNSLMGSDVDVDLCTSKNKE